MKRPFLKSFWWRVLGFAALLWFLIRVIPKPSRAAYPCQRAAFPLASAFVLWLAGWISSITWLAGIRKSREVKLLLQLFSAILLVGIFATQARYAAAWQPFRHAGAQESFSPVEGPNRPMGTGRGIHPGRVAWVYDPGAVRFDGITGKFWEPGSVDQAAVDSMLARSLRLLSGESTSSAAWHSMFRHFNRTAGRAGEGYRPGEKIAVKINMNTAGRHADLDGGTNTSPHVIRALASQLTRHAGVPDSCITFFEISRPIPDYVFEYVSSEFPGIRFVDPVGENGRRLFVRDTSCRIAWSEELTLEEGGGHPTFLPLVVSRADYLINLGNLKGHDLAGVTICAKNHVGTIISDNPGNSKLSSPRAAGIHPYIAVHDFAYWNLPMRDTATYNTLVDLMGHRHLGGKTLLFIIDGIFAVKTQHANVDAFQRWESHPFNGNFTASILASMDGVAVESVGLDLLRSEPTMTQVYGNVDNYLHEASLAHAPPSGTRYDPEQDGSGLASLGAHEHWNSAWEKKYSVNLGTGQGIELLSFRVGGHTPAPPDSLRAEIMENRLVSLHWKDRSDNETGFVLERREPGYSEFITHGLIPPDHVQWTDTVPWQGPEVQYRIASKGEQGTSAYTETVTIRTTDIPEPSRVKVAEPLHIYPNPAGDLVNIRLPGTVKSGYTLTVFDTGGRLIRRFSPGSSGSRQLIRVELGHLPRGPYLLKLETSEHVYVKYLILN